MRPRLVLALAALLLAAGLAGCGLGAGARSTGAAVLVTRDFGSRDLGGRIVQDAPSSETVMRLLQRDFKVATRYGGGFVQSIDGLAGGRGAGRPLDWFFYVNGLESEKGASDVSVHDGDRIWWDRHDWGATPHVAAVVGSFPEPFLHGSGGKRYPVVLECADDVSATCARVGDSLAAAGVRALGRQVLGTGVGQDTLRVFVGRWSELRSDAALEQIDRGPSVSGVYARFQGGGRTLALLDARGGVARTLGAGAGLIAATRFQQQAPTWVVSGTDLAGVAGAARALREPSLRRHFALAVTPTGDVALPLLR